MSSFTKRSSEEPEKQFIAKPNSNWPKAGVTSVEITASCLTLVGCISDENCKLVGKVFGQLVGGQIVYTLLQPGLPPVTPYEGEWEFCESVDASVVECSEEGLPERFCLTIPNSVSGNGNALSEYIISSNGQTLPLPIDYQRNDIIEALALAGIKTFEDAQGQVCSEQPFSILLEGAAASGEPPGVVYTPFRVSIPALRHEASDPETNKFQRAWTKREDEILSTLNGISIKHDLLYSKICEFLIGVVGDPNAPCPDCPENPQTVCYQEGLITYAQPDFSITGVEIGGEDVSSKFTLPIDGNIAPALSTFKDELSSCLLQNGIIVVETQGRDGWLFEFTGQPVKVLTTGEGQIIFNSTNCREVT